MKTTFIIGMVAALILVVGLGLYLSRSGSQGSAVAQGGNIFAGRMIGSSLAPQTITGLRALSDQGCSTNPRTGLSNCTTSFAYGNRTIYFNYEHNMMMQPCISRGDLVDLAIQAGGTAVVTRTYWAGGGA